MIFYARDTPGVEELMDQHQSRKTEIDARQESFQSVIAMGEELLKRNHYASNEVSFHHNSLSVLSATFSQSTLFPCSLANQLKRL